MKIACIVQGNVRYGTELILNEMSKKFDYLIFSTWKGEIINFKADNFITIFNEKPLNSGFSNRNLLRISTYAALTLCSELNCDFVCKIRSDMLFLSISKEKLFYLLGHENFSKILTFNFRCLTSNPDWYSSINDIFSFGSLEMSLLLWSVEGFDFTKSYNIPCDPALMALESEHDFLELWQPETEFYSFFKYRITSISPNDNNHVDIIRKYFVLVEYDTFRILWFSDKSFRSVFQAYHHPWWSMNNFYGKSQPRIARTNRSLNLIEKFKFKFSSIIVNYNILIQKVYYFHFCLLKLLKK